MLSNAEEFVTQAHPDTNIVLSKCDKLPRPQIVKQLYFRRHLKDLL